MKTLRIPKRDIQLPWDYLAEHFEQAGVVRENHAHVAEKSGISVARVDKIAEGEVPDVLECNALGGLLGVWPQSLRLLWSAWRGALELRERMEFIRRPKIEGSTRDARSAGGAK